MAESKTKIQNSKAENRLNTPRYLVRLARLIGTLTKDQKREFTKGTGKWSQKVEPEYAWLFRTINRLQSRHMPENELMAALIKIRLAEESTDKKKTRLPKPARAKARPTLAKPAFNFSSAARHLYNSILASVRNSQDAFPHLTRLKCYIQDIYYLYLNSRYEDCLPLLRDGIQWAKKLDKPTLRLELLQLERQVRIYGAFPDTADRMHFLEEDEALAVRQIAAFSYYSNLAYQLVLANNQQKRPDGALRKELQKALDPKEGARVKALSSRATARYYGLLSLFYWLESLYGQKKSRQSATEKAWGYRRQLLDIYHDNWLLTEEDRPIYLSAVDFYLNIGLTLGKQEAVEAYIGYLADTKDPLVDLRSGVFIRLQMFLMHHQFEEACSYIEKKHLAERLEKEKDRLPESRHIALLFSCASCWFGMERFVKVQNWVKPLSNFEPKLRPDLRIVSLFMEAISAYEKEKRNYTAAAEILARANDFLLQMQPEQIPPLSELIAVLQEMFAQPGGHRSDFRLHRLVRNSVDNWVKNNPVNNCDLILAWLEAKIKGSSVAKEVAKYSS